MSDQIENLIIARGCEMFGLVKCKIMVLMKHSVISNIGHQNTHEYH